MKIYQTEEKPIITEDQRRAATALLMKFWERSLYEMSGSALMKAIMGNEELSNAVRAWMHALDEVEQRECEALAAFEKVFAANKFPLIGDEDIPF